MQPVPCLRISERTVRFPSDQILGGDSLIQKQKNKDPEINRGSPRRHAPLRGCDRMANPLGTLGLGLVICLFMLCIVGFCFFILMILCLKALACIFTFCHTWYSHASLYYYYLFEGTHI